jgi:squalene-associated FAD-dependent desaturase
LTAVTEPNPARVHIIGAGLAGLAAAVRLAHLGPALTVYEAAPRAGGRCRSYHDPLLNCVIDNGNHLLMSGNGSAMEYLAEIGAADRLAGPVGAAFPFVDVTTRTRWTVEPGKGVVPWWIFSAKRRVPDTEALDYLSAMRLLRAPVDATVADCVGTSGSLYRNFWEPLTVAALNTAPEQGAAVLMRPVLRETFMRGADACRPLVARDSLAATMVDPAIEKLQSAGADIRFGTRVRGLVMDKDRVTALDIDGTTVDIASSDIVILAVPPWVAETLVPDLKVPPAGEPIVNVHYRLAKPVTAPGEVKIIGVIGGLAQWVFARGELASVTISAAAAVVDDSAEDIARRCWSDVALALELQDTAEAPSRVVKERRATFAQTPETIRLRHGTATAYLNLLLAGDWTATGLPATIEGAVRSGFRAASLAVTRRATLSSRAHTTQTLGHTEAA